MKQIEFNRYYVRGFMKDYYDEDVSVYVISSDKVVVSLNNPKLN